MTDTCKVCKHWAAGPDPFLWTDDGRQKAGLWSECQRIDFEGSLLFLTDRFESIVTHEDFGCVMFEMKEHL